MMTDSELQSLLKTLLALPKETEWVEFKHNQAEPEEIGEYLSAISNASSLLGKETGYIIWGVTDGSHDVVGTTFKPRKKKIGNQELESWLALQLNPRIDFYIDELLYEDLPVVIFRVQPCRHTPVRWKDTRPLA